MEQKNTNSIDEIMDEMQSSLLDKSQCEVEDSRCGRCCNCREGQGQVINITFSPVINTTSTTKERTKNSPIKELGSTLVSMMSFIR